MNDIARKIRALLDKAEATDYPEERDTFIAKATALMVQHNIDQAMVAGVKDKDAGTVTSRTIDGAKGPYAAAKHTLLNAACGATGCESWRGNGMFTIVGTADQINMTETLYTSFLLQCASGIERSWMKADGHKTRFARSYMLGFAAEVSMRITVQVAATVREAETATPGAGLVLVDMADRIDDWKRDQGIRLRTTRINGSGSREGDQAGRRDGRNADIGNRGVQGARGVLA